MPPVGAYVSAFSTISELVDLVAVIAAVGAVAGRLQPVVLAVGEGRLRSIAAAAAGATETR